MSDTLSKIKELAKSMFDNIMANKQPKLDIPIRSLSNVKYDVKDGYFELNGKVKTRTLSVPLIKK